ncbi:MAG TPA: metallopeptidase TldD-related protein [Bryobacteraceae bacterium]|nr:metallopeptidase TldD-related protein [Bryobacteraceae bacterium]
MTARRLIVKSAALAVGLAASAAWLISQTVGLSLPNDEILLRAMRDELQRSKQLAVVAGQDAPYFFSYSLTDAESLHISASMGAVVSVFRNRFRSPSAEVRVGSYDFDNTGHIFSGIYSGSRYDGNWPLDDDYGNFRSELWLSTDRAFKAAVESMARKRASLKNSAVSAEPLPDFSKVTPVVSIGKVSRPKVEDEAWKERAARLAAIFNNYKEVLSSGLELQMIQGPTTLMNSEGTAVRYNDDMYWLYAKAEGQAPDGMLLHDAASIQALELDKFPSEAEMRKTLTEVGENVRALVRAPQGESYSGAVLLEPRAAAQLLAQLLGDNLRVPRRPLSDPGRNVNFAPSEFETRVGGRVLPDSFDVTDDATQSTFNGKPLAGFYPFDLEGVPPKPVSVVEKGVLKNFLTTRQPIRGFPASNGHARLPGNYGTFSAAIGNLFVKSSETASMADLKKRLIDLTKMRGKPYGMLVRKLDYPYSATASELQSLAQASSQSGGSARPVSPPLLIYRVYPDGREELVRGLRFRGLTSRTLRDVLAASSESEAFDFVNVAAPLAILGAGGYLAPASVISPGLLFDELELEPPQDQLPKPPTVPPPNSAN